VIRQVKLITWAYGGLYLEIYGAICGGVETERKTAKKKKK